ncbi:MAG: HEAT repeat domain-containing protein [Leptolyngbyaceae cyanobacterium]
MYVEKKPAPMSDAVPLAPLIDCLIGGDFREKWETTKQLTELGPTAIAALVALLGDADLDWETQWFVARALGQFDHPDALAALVALLHSTQEPELIAIAAEGLTHFGASGVEALLQLLRQPAHRLTATQALANIHHPATFQPLLAAATDPDPTIRAVAFTALSHFRRGPVDDLLLAGLQDVNPVVRQEAIRQLGVRSYLLERINLIEHLLPGLWDINPAVNQATVIALGRLGTETAIAALTRVLTSPHTPTALQLSIIQTLGWIDTESALSALITARNTLPRSLHPEIVETLTRFQGDPLRRRAGEMLQDWLRTEMRLSTDGEWLQAALALALGSLHYQPALPLLQSLLRESDGYTQLYAQTALRQLTNTDSAEILD